MTTDGEVGEPKMQCTLEEMKANRVPLNYRDFCAHKLIPLNKCRQKNFYMPFKCVDERHAYEKCQYEQYLRRVKEMKQIVKEERRQKREAKEAKEAAELAAVGATS